MKKLMRGFEGILLAMSTDFQRSVRLTAKLVFKAPLRGFQLLAKQTGMNNCLKQPKTKHNITKQSSKKMQTSNFYTACLFLKPLLEVRFQPNIGCILLKKPTHLKF